MARNSGVVAVVAVMVFGIGIGGVYLAGGASHPVVKPGADAADTPTTIAADLNLVFTARPENASTAPITAAEAWANYGSTSDIPNSETVQYGTLTMPLTSPDTPDSKTEYRFHNEPVWSFSSLECARPVGVPGLTLNKSPLPAPDQKAQEPASQEPAPSQDDTASCVTYNFFSATTGDPLLRTQQR